jgi:hypothetical protein
LNRVLDRDSPIMDLSIFGQTEVLPLGNLVATVAMRVIKATSAGEDGAPEDVAFLRAWVCSEQRDRPANELAYLVIEADLRRRKNAKAQAVMRAAETGSYSEASGVSSGPLSIDDV